MLKAGGCILYIHYSCPGGDVVVCEDTQNIVASVDFIASIDHEAERHIAESECFLRVGQGLDKEGAIRSLVAVLRVTLGMMHAHGRLTATLDKAPWTREIIDQERWDALIATWQQRSDRCLVIVGGTPVGA